jgi:prickle
MLEEQLPPHDTDPKYCRTLNEDEKNELRIFNEQQRHNALGRASARQLPLTQSPMPCRGVSYSSFILLRSKINTYTSYET